MSSKKHPHPLKDHKDVFICFSFYCLHNNKSENTELCKMIKSADDTVVIGLISNNDECKYRNTIDYVTNWCKENFL